MRSMSDHYIYLDITEWQYITDVKCHVISLTMSLPLLDFECMYVRSHHFFIIFHRMFRNDLMWWLKMISIGERHWGTRFLVQRSSSFGDCPLFHRNSRLTRSFEHDNTWSFMWRQLLLRSRDSRGHVIITQLETNPRMAREDSFRIEREHHSTSPSRFPRLFRSRDDSSHVTISCQTN